MNVCQECKGKLPPKKRAYCSEVCKKIGRRRRENKIYKSTLHKTCLYTGCTVQIYKLNNPNYKRQKYCPECAVIVQKQRVYQHKHKLQTGFTTKYNINKLIYYEMFIESYNAISREK